MESKNSMEILDGERAVQRLGKYYKDGNKGYEVFTSMLWIDFFANWSPPNTTQGWLFGSEFVYSNLKPYSDSKGAPNPKIQQTGRCDIFLCQSKANWPKNYNATGLQFLAAEFESGGATEEDWTTAQKQLSGCLTYLKTYLDHGQTLFGVTAAGNLCTFYERKDGTLERLGRSARLDISNQEDFIHVIEILDGILERSPVKITELRMVLDFYKFMPRTFGDAVRQREYASPPLRASNELMSFSQTSLSPIPGRIYLMVEPQDSLKI